MGKIKKVWALKLFYSFKEEKPYFLKFKGRKITINNRLFLVRKNQIVDEETGRYLDLEEYNIDILKSINLEEKKLIDIKDFGGVSKYHQARKEALKGVEKVEKIENKSK
jgi:hypothetical protein